MNTYGIDEVIWKNIVTTCFNFPGVEKIILYGSRARGDHQRGSDIDLAIDAPLMTAREFSMLWNILDDLPIVYTLDIVHLQTLTNKPLIRAIDQEGVVFERP